MPLVNDFANLSAERVEDRLAMVQPDELFAVATELPAETDQTME